MFLAALIVFFRSEPLIAHKRVPKTFFIEKTEIKYEDIVIASGTKFEFMNFGNEKQLSVGGGTHTLVNKVNIYSKPQKQLNIWILPLSTNKKLQ